MRRATGNQNIVPCVILARTFTATIFLREAYRTSLIFGDAFGTKSPRRELEQRQAVPMPLRFGLVWRPNSPTRILTCAASTPTLDCLETPRKHTNTRYASPRRYIQAEPRPAWMSEGHRPNCLQPKRRYPESGLCAHYGSTRSQAWLQNLPRLSPSRLSRCYLGRPLFRFLHRRSCCNADLISQLRSAAQRRPMRRLGW